MHFLKNQTQFNTINFKVLVFFVYLIFNVLSKIIKVLKLKFLKSLCSTITNRNTRLNKKKGM